MLNICKSPLFQAEQTNKIRFYIISFLSFLCVVVVGWVFLILFLIFEQLIYNRKLLCLSLVREEKSKTHDRSRKLLFPFYFIFFVIFLSNLLLTTQIYYN